MKDSRRRIDAIERAFKKLGDADEKDRPEGSRRVERWLLNDAASHSLTLGLKLYFQSYNDHAF